MKNIILILCTAIAAIGLTAFTFYNGFNTEANCKSELSETNDIREKNNIDKPKVVPNLFYSFGSMYAPIPKDQVHSANTVEELFSDEDRERIVSVESSYIIVIKNGKRTNRIEMGTGGTLSEGQKKLLRSFDYTSEFIVKAHIKQKNVRTGELENDQTEPHYSVVPQQQATNEMGTDALVDYIKENAEAKLPLIDSDNLLPSKIIFTIDKNGGVSNIKLDQTSGYPSYDSIMLDLMQNLPGKWTPAEESNGEKTEQILALTYGMGC